MANSIMPIIAHLRPDLIKEAARQKNEGKSNVKVAAWLSLATGLDIGCDVVRRWWDTYLEQHGAVEA